MDCDRYHLYHPSWAYSVRGLASRSDGGPGLAGITSRLWLARWLAFCIMARLRLGTLALVWVVCHRIGVDIAANLRVAVCIRRLASDSPGHCGIIAGRYAGRCFILGQPTSWTPKDLTIR